MGIFEINWAVGGRVMFSADTPEEAQLHARELLPRGGDWQDIDVIPVEENSQALT